MTDQYSKGSKFWKASEGASTRDDILVKRRVLELLDEVNGKRIIDLGCGNGNFSSVLAERGASVVGIDSNKDMIEEAKEKNKNDKTRFFIGRVDSLPEKIEGGFDIGLSLLVALHLDREGFRRFIEEANSVMGAGGRFILGNIHPFRVLKSEDSRWIKTEFDPETKNYFEEEELKAKLRKVDGGSFDIEYYHHSLQFVLNTLLESGFTLERIIEPRPTNQEKKEYEEFFTYEYERPSYIIFVCRKTKQANRE